MNIKKYLGTALACVLLGAVLAGCGGEEKGKTAENKDLPIGVLAHLNASEEQYNEFAKQAEKQYSKPGQFAHKFIYYDNLNAMEMALSAGKIKEMSTYKSVADYLIMRNGEFVISDHGGRVLADAFCCALSAQESELKAQFDQVIDDMKKDGTLKALADTYITGLKDGAEPPAVELPRLDGAGTIKVGVTGDLPPLDLVLPDGKAAGFSTAVLAELSRRVGKNVEIVNIDSAARASALTSGKVDVVFWVAVPADGSFLPGNADTPQGIVVTKPYYEDVIVHVTKK